MHLVLRKYELIFVKYYKSYLLMVSSPQPKHLPRQALSVSSIYVCFL